ncbi:hypothetical protein PRUB_b1067 [Pseudoalteromonas rubra]|uniref:Uncharacterized protein n=1 Tax=Pseudoalteromonas rubra TaxID=43658 RepID=A0A8T0C1D5_9GAMM|nr:hypothetical protein PRUB_b1067 [Pseudoalteromonas rubra]
MNTVSRYTQSPLSLPMPTNLLLVNQSAQLISRQKLQRH